MKANRTSIKLAISAILTVLLVVSLVGVTFALFRAVLELHDNRVTTATVGINLNDRKPVIDMADPNEPFKFLEPGMTVEKECFVENTGTADAYYRIYMENCTGFLATVVEITVRDGSKELYSGTIADMTPELVSSAPLAIGERRDLNIVFHYPRNSNNYAKNTKLTFNLCAEAVQQRNNNPLNPFNSK